MLLVLPAILLTAGTAAGRTLPRRWRIVVGLAGGLGLAIKPYFLPVWVALELYAQSSTRPRILRAENVAIASILVAYALTVALFIPDYFSNVKLAVGSYGAYDAPLWYVLSRSPWALIGIATVLLIGARFGRTDTALAVPLWLAMVCFAVGAIVQRKGWPYHWLPALVLAIAVIAVLVLGWADRRRVAGADHWLPALGLAALAVIAVRKDFSSGTAIDEKRAKVVTDLAEVVRAQAAGQSVAWLSSDLWPEFPTLSYAGARSALHFDYLWILPRIYGESAHINPPGQRGSSESLLFESMVHDLEAKHPALIVVDRRSVKQGFFVPFDFEGYFATDDRFRAVLSSYHVVAEQHGFRFYAASGGRGSTNEPRAP